MQCLHLGFERLLTCVRLLGLLAIALQAMPVAAAPFAYVTDSDVFVIDTATNTVVTTIPLEGCPFTGCVPFGVAITPNGAFAYVADQSSGNVSVIATATNTVVATIPIGVAGSSIGVAITPNGAFAYVTVSASPNVVVVIATATNTVVATIPLGAGSPIGVAITPNGAFAYVTGPGVSVIATATNTVVAFIPIFPVGSQTDGVAITPNGAFAYVPVATFANGRGTNGFVAVVDTATNTEVAFVGVGVGPSQIAITPAPADTTPPSCAVTAVLPGPPKQVQITAQDAQGGLKQIIVLEATNCTVTVPSFTPGTTHPCRRHRHQDGPELGLPHRAAGARHGQQQHHL